MVVSETVERSVRLRGPCSSWFPLVRDSLSAHGGRRIAVGESSYTLTANFGDAPVSGSVAVSLSAVSDGDTVVSIAVSVLLDCASGLCCGEAVS